MADAKKGRLSAAEIRYLTDNRDRRSLEQMAAHLNRAHSQVRRHLEQTAPEGQPIAQDNLALELENRPEWAVWQDQFSPNELKFFQYRYRQLVGQFGRDDILPTEEMQVFTLIQNDLLAQRTLREQKKISEEMDWVQDRIIEINEQARGTAGDTTARKATHKEADVLERKYQELSSAQKGVTARYESYQMRNSRILSELKATRDQRVKVVEGSRQSFLGLLKSLMQEDFRAREGEQMELVRLATQREKARLARPTEYADGTMDQPLLTPETVLETYDQEVPTP